MYIDVYVARIARGHFPEQKSQNIVIIAEEIRLG